MRKHCIREKLRDKSGAALVTVLTIFLTIVIIISSATAVAHANYARAKRVSSHSSAYYIAETGLNETYDAFINYFDNNREDRIFDENYIKEFIFASGGQNQNLLYDYGFIMGQQASSLTTLEAVVHDNEHYKVHFKSTGYLGDTSRTVEISIDIVNSVISSSYQPDSLLSLDFVDTETPMQFPWNGSKLMGPIITNKKVKIDEPIVAGPVVLSNTIEFLNYSVDWREAVLITSGKVKVNRPSVGTKIKTIVLKPGGNLDLNATSVPDIGIEYILIPESSKNNEEQLFQLQGKASQDLFDSFESKGKIIYYNPLNFNPYEEKHPRFDYIFSNIGENKFEYDEYFKPNFILDNLDDEEIRNKFLPQVVMPKKPDILEFYPYGHQTIAPETIHNYQLVDANNNLRYSPSWYWQGVDTIEIGQHPLEQLDGKKSQRFYNSFILEGTSDYNNALNVYIGDRDVTIITRTLKMTGHIKVIGTGSLRIYVIGDDDKITRNNFVLEPHSLVLKDNIRDSKIKEEAQKLLFYVYETSEQLTVHTKGNASTDVFTGTIFSENLNLKSLGHFNGNFISAKGTSVIFENAGGSGQSQLIFAPNAIFDLKGNEFKGVAVAKNYKFGQHTKLTFSSNFDRSFVDEILSEVIVIGDPNSSGGTLGDYLKGPIREVKK